MKPKRSIDDWVDKYMSAFLPESEDELEEEPIMCKLCLDNIVDIGDDTCKECKDFLKEEKNGNKKESRIFTRNSFSWRSGRDSNPRPHA